MIKKIKIIKNFNKKMKIYKKQFKEVYQKIDLYNFY